MSSTASIDHDVIKRTYVRMAKLGHRPLANAAYMNEPGRLAGEAANYAHEFSGENDRGTFVLGCSGLRAAIFAIESVRAMNDDNITTAARLLKAAAAELYRHERSEQARPAVAATEGARPNT